MSGAPRESSVERAIVRHARDRHCLAFKFSSPGTAGVPDRLIVSPDGRVLFLEVKRPGEKPRPLQRHWLLKLKSMGVRAEWCDTVEQGRDYVDALLSDA